MRFSENETFNISRTNGCIEIGNRLFVSVFLYTFKWYNNFQNGILNFDDFSCFLVFHHSIFIVTVCFYIFNLFRLKLGA